MQKYKINFKENGLYKELLMMSIADYIYHTMEIKEIIKQLYEHTELFENKYEHEFRLKLWKFFAGKITRSTLEYNKIMSLLDENEVKNVKIRIEELKRLYTEGGY